MNYVDFHYVAPEHIAIDRRLVNWARWAKPQHSAAVSPMFRHYRPYLYPETQAGSPIDQIDAIAIQKCMAHIPEKHRHALGWCYIYRSNPTAAARALGTSKDGLMQIVRDARTMISNRVDARQAATA